MKYIEIKNIFFVAVISAVLFILFSNNAGETLQSAHDDFFLWFLYVLGHGGIAK